MILGFMMILDLSARNFAAASIGACRTPFQQALKHRRSVRLHAGYLLATPSDPV